MKKLFALIVAIALPVFAAAPTFSVGPYYVGRLQVDPVIDTSGAITGCSVHVYYKADLINTDTQAHTVQSDYQADKSIDCIANAAKTVTFTFAGQSYTMPYGLLVSGVAAAALQEAPAQ